MTVCCHHGKITARLFDLRGRGQDSWVIFIHTLDIFLWVSSWLSSFSGSHRKKLMGWFHNLFGSSSCEQKWKGKRKERGEKGRGERAREREALLCCSQVDDESVWKLKKGFPINWGGPLWHHWPCRSANVLTSTFYCHTCFYSESPNVPLRLNSFLL